MPPKCVLLAALFVLFAFSPARADPPAPANPPAYYETFVNHGCDKFAKKWGVTGCWGRYLDTFSIGAGAQALTLRFDGKIGFLDQVAPLEIALNYGQYATYNTATEKFTTYSFRVALGLSIANDPDKGFQFGIYLAPVGFRIDNFTIGLGLGYLADADLKFGKENFNMVIPLTYTLMGTAK